MANFARRLALMIALTLAFEACEGGQDENVETSLAGASSRSSKSGNAAQGATASGGAAAERGSRVFRDSDFVESETNRDPFRSFLAPPGKAAAPPKTQRLVLMPNTPIQSVRLIAIVTGIAQPKAMMVDEKGVGYVASRGDFVGRAEVVQSGGSENLPVSLNWRVDRIRENEVVLAREDPSGPNRPPLTRVIALHEPDEEKEAGIRIPGQDS